MYLHTCLTLAINQAPDNSTKIVGKYYPTIDSGAAALPLPLTRMYRTIQPFKISAAGAALLFG